MLGGFEHFAQLQRDLTAETVRCLLYLNYQQCLLSSMQAAKKLRELPDVHYLDKK